MATGPEQLNDDITVLLKKIGEQAARDILRIIEIAQQKGLIPGIESPVTVEDALEPDERDDVIREQARSVAEMASELLELRHERGKARAEVEELETQRDAAMDHAASLAELLDRITGDFRQVRAERDEWRREAESRAPSAVIERVLLERNQLKERRATVLDIVGCPDDASDVDLFRVLRALIEEQPKFKPGQRVRVGRHLGTVQTSHPTMRVRLDGCEIAEFLVRHVHHVDEAPHLGGGSDG